MVKKCVDLEWFKLFKGVFVVVKFMIGVING